MKSSLIALVLVAAALFFALAEETPVGRLDGAVVLQRTGAPIAGARVVLTPREANGQLGGPRYAMSGADGKFILPRVVAGVYNLSASTHAHSVSGLVVSVVEGRVETVRLAMRRSQPDLVPAQRQRFFRTGEEAELPIRGYIDAAVPGDANRLRVRLWKARLSALLADPRAAQALDRVGSEWRAPEPLPAALLRPSLGVTLLPQAQPAQPITEADAEGFFVKNLRFGRLGPGLYLVQVDNGQRAVSAWINVSSLALVLKSAPGELLAFAADVQSGEAAAGATISLFRDGKRVRESQTDVHGVARFAVGAEASEVRLMAVAARGADEAVVERAEYDAEQSGAHRIHVYTDRPIYRPGHEVSYKVIAREIVGSRLAVPAGQEAALEVRDPSGEIVHRSGGPVNAFGARHGKFTLSAEASSGTYTMVVAMAGTQATHDLLVASYRKPEFSVTVTTDKPRYIRGEAVKVTIRGAYYFGGPLAGSQVRYSIYAAPDWTSTYADLDPDEADAEARRYGTRQDGEIVAEGAAVLDESGQTVVAVPAAMRAVDGPDQVDYIVQATVIDTSGREATAETSVPVAGAAVRVQAHTEGFLETPGRPIPVRVRVADLDGRAVAGAPVVLEPAYDEWNAETHEAVRKPLPDVRGTTDTHGIANVLFVAPRQGFVRLTARAHDGAQREARGIAYLWVVGAGEGSLDARYGALSLHTDKRRYQPGEVARVLVNSDAVGYTVLLTIEGDRIGAAWSVPIRARSTVVMVPVRAEYGPNVILAAASVREKKFASAEAPLRVDVPARALSVVLRADKPRYAPGETATYDVEISDASGRPARAEFSLAVVDESIYALQEDDPNALRDAFYPRRHNRVRTTFSFAVKYLGDADKGAGGIQPRRRFLDTAYWGPVHRTDEAGRARISVRLPDNLTTWRATVIAHALDTAVGRQVHKSLVTKDFFVRVEMPRLLTERDVGRVLAIVHNNTERARLATVRFQASGLTVAGPDTQPVFVEPGASAEAAWPVKASGPGAAKLTVTAWTDGAGADRLTDGVEVPLPIRAYGRDQVLEVAGEAAAARVERKTLMLDASAAPAGAKLTVRVTPSITSGVAGALEYLVDYPYGCVEQTMSRFLPSLLARKLARGGAPLDAAVAARVPAIVADGLARLRRQQHESGAWGWWEHDDDHPWMTAYVLHGLAIAKQEGAPVGDDFLQRAREAAARLQTSNPNERMFLWYGLALAGDTETPRAALAKAPPRWGALGPEGLAYAVLLAKHLGQDAAAPFAELMKRARADADTLSWAPGAGADRWWRWNWSDRSTTAAALRAMIAHDRRDPRAGAVLRWLMRARAGDHWGSTRDTSFVLAALADYLAAAPESARPRGELRIKLNGQLVRTVTLSPEMARGPAVTVDLPTDLLNAGANSLLIERDGEGSVFWTARFRQTIAADELPAVGARGVTVRREYLRAVTRRAGPEAWTLQLESANNEFRQNDRVVVRVTVETSRDLAYILLEDLFPSGFEPNERGSAEIDEWRYWWTSIDVRDDRVAFFARELPAGKHVFEYNLRAQTPGQYQALPAVLSGMYHPEVRAESAGGQVKIR